MNNKVKMVFIICIIVFVALIVGCSSIIEAEPIDIPIFLYHSVRPELGENEGQDMVVTSTKFEEDLKYLKDNGYTSIDLKTLINYKNNPRTKLPKKPFMITFDDGYLNNYKYAYPLLKEYNTKAVIYTIVWSVGRDTFILKDEPLNPHFSWDQGREMIQSGLIQLGSHTFDMHNSPGVSYGYEDICGLGLEPIDGENEEDHYKRIYSDLEKSKALMEENLGVGIDTIAYPYGKYNDTVIQVVKDLGFKLGFIVEDDGPDKSIFEIKRIPVRNDKKMQDILITD